MAAESFGTTPAGAPVDRLSISGGGLSAKILTFGAILQDLRLDGHDAPLVLGFDRLEDYLADTSFMGAVVGRFANRIRDGKFTIDGRRYQAEANDGRHALHGGAGGFWNRVWKIAHVAPHSVTLALDSPAGEMGFPGNLAVACTYLLKPRGVLSVELTATTDAPTLCSLAQHSYFNLDNGGGGDMLDHRLMIAAGAYLPVDGEMIPTGVVQPADGTEFDFMMARPVRTASADTQIGYDHNFCLAAARGPLRQAAWVQGATSGVELDLWTTEPGLQLYAGGKLMPLAPGLDGRRYGAFSGLALEPQIWPDAPNRPYFPQAVLRPGETCRQQTEYRFSLS